MQHHYLSVEPARAEINALTGPVLIEFGADWCGYCQAVQPLIEAALAAFPDVRHIKVADGKGRPLGRSFRVTLWPTLIFLQEGREVSRLVRPNDAASIRDALHNLQ